MTSQMCPRESQPIAKAGDCKLVMLDYDGALWIRSNHSAKSLPRG